MTGIRGWMLVAGTALALSLAAPALAAADTITVNTTDDVHVGMCTLRDAITAANTAAPSSGCPYAPGGDVADPDTINFSVPLPATINLPTNKLPDVLYPLSIIGPGAGLLDIHRTSASDFRILTINPNGGPDTDLVSGLTLSNGSLAEGVGAGISMNFSDVTLDHVVVSGNHITINSTPTTGSQGAGIFNNVDGTLHLVDSTVSDNHVALNVPGFFGAGGGIYNGGTMTAVDSTISGNDVTSTAAGSGQAFAFGGGIYTSDATTITRSTIFDNSAAATSGTNLANSAGGGLLSTGSLNLRLSTVGGNQASSTTTGTPAAGGGLALDGNGAVLTGDTIAFNTGALSGNLSSEADQPDSPIVRDTIISNPFGPNCSFDAGGSLTSGGYNVEDDATGSCLLEAPHDLALGTDPLLNPMLVNNLGPTRTYALQAGSPAIEAGSSFGQTTDQRGLLRRSDDLAVPTKAGSDGSDIGAFEVQGQPFAGPPPPPSTTPTPTPTAPAHKKKCKKHKKRSAQSAKKKCKKKKRK
jgi:trimeric autotransporter adhesin